MALGVLGGVACGTGLAGLESPLLRLLAVPLAGLPGLRALWVLLPGLGGVDALRLVDGSWSLGRTGHWVATECVAKVEIHQIGWWVVFRCAHGRHWVWLDMRGDEPDLRREMARALRSATDPWAR